MQDETIEKIVDCSPEVIKYLEHDPIRYAQDIHNLKFESELIQDFYVCRRQTQIIGHISKCYSPEAILVSLSGFDESVVQSLLETLPKDKMVITAEPRHSGMVEAMMNPSTVVMNYLMAVEKSEVKLVHPNQAILLTPDYAEEYASFPYWPIPVDWARERLAKDHVLGLVVNGKLVSVASVTTRILQTGTITGVETLEDFRGRGYATLVVSKAVEDALKHSETASLIVRKDNSAALHIYERLNFKTFGEVAWLDVGTGLLP